MTVTGTAKMQALKELSESEFRRDVLMPLLRKMPGHSNVQELHGTNELGKDIVFTVTESLTTRHCAVVAKVGQISGASKGEGTLGVVQTQIEQCFDNPYPCSITKTHKQIDQVFVWTTGTISSTARTQIANQGANKYRNVVFIDGEKTIEYLDEYYPSFFTIRDPYISDYFKNASKHHGMLEELRGLGGTSKDLREIFVEPKLKKIDAAPARVQEKGTAQKKEEMPISFWQFCIDSRSFLLLGDQGSGKTTLLRKVLLKIIEENLRSVKRTPIPVLVNAANIDMTSENPILEVVDKEYRKFDQNRDSTGLTAEIEQGNVIILIDALDELREESKILEARRLIVEFKKTYSKTRMIVSSRKFTDLSEFNIAGFVALEPTAFSDKQVTVFVTKWFADDRTKAQKLIKQFKERLLSSGLGKSPLILTLVAVLYENGSNEIPESLTDLYGRYLELCLGRWDSIRSIKMVIEWNIKHFLLRRISWHMHQNGDLTISEHDLRELAKQTLLERGQDRDADPIIDEILNRSELLYRNEEGEYQFKHISFQDYFAACEISDFSDVAAFVSEKFLEWRWQNTNFFVCGLKPSSDVILKALLQNVKPSNGNEEMAFAIQLGMCTQAAYLAPNDTKKEVLKAVLDGLVKAWGSFGHEFIQKMNEVVTDQVDEETHKEISHFVATLFFGVMARQALGSPSFRLALHEATQACKTLDETTSPRERAEVEWKNFFISAACSGCELVDDFVKLMDRKYVDRPELFLMGTYYITFLKSYKWLEPTQMRMVVQLEKKLKKKLRGTIAYFEKIETEPPVPLPEENPEHEPENSAAIVDVEPMVNVSHDEEPVLEDGDGTV